MNLAVTEWQGRISPVFDVAEYARVFCKDETGIRYTGSIKLMDSEGEKRIILLKNAGVQLLLCGAISGYMERLAQMQGIEVIPFLSGNTDRIIKLFATDLWQDKIHRMPGCGRRNRCGFGRQKRGNRNKTRR